MNRFRLWPRWHRRFSLYKKLLNKGASHEDAPRLISLAHPINVHDFIYDHMARRRHRAPRVWDPAPSKKDAESLARELLEMRKKIGLSDEEMAEGMLSEAAHGDGAEIAVFREFLAMTANIK